jgi:hypothetical protein
VCQIYVDDIIFGCTEKRYSEEFSYMMQEQYQMSMMGELKFFLGLRIRQQHNGIFISQEKYLKDCLKKFGMQDCKGHKMPMLTNGQLDTDATDKDFLKSKVFKPDSLDPTLFTKSYDGELFVCQIYVDDIIFGCTEMRYSEEFSRMMQEQYEMSMMGELRFFLGLQNRQ